MYEQVIETTAFLKNKLPTHPRTAIVLGSGLSGVVTDLKHPTVIPYSDIPHFRSSTVEGHESVLVSGELNGTDVLLLSGRLHFYEGVSMQDISFPIYVLKLLGIEQLILTNSSGGINQDKLEAGSIMVLNDFINFQPTNPLVGPNDERFGPRFPDMTEPYCEELRGLALEKAALHNLRYVEGVYAAFPGPYYETKAEIEMLKRMGADAVGMSTVPETIVANYLGIRVLAFATITNMATGIQAKKHSHDHVVHVAQKTSGVLAAWIKDIVADL